MLSTLTIEFTITTGWRALQKHPDTSMCKRAHGLPITPSRKTLKIACSLNVDCEILFLEPLQAQSPVHGMQLKRVETNQASPICTCSSDEHCIGLAKHMIYCTVLAKAWHQKPQSTTRQP